VSAIRCTDGKSEIEREVMKQLKLADIGHKGKLPSILVCAKATWRICEVVEDSRIRMQFSDSPSGGLGEFRLGK
jgi:hypothetical protein